MVNKLKCRQTMLVSYLYFFIFLGVFITDIWPDIHGPSEPGLALFLGYFKLSLQFLQIGLSSLIVISSYLVTFFRSRDKTFSSESEISNLRSSTSEAKGSGHNIISTRTLISNISTWSTNKCILILKRFYILTFTYIYPLHTGALLSWPDSDE